MEQNQSRVDIVALAIEIEHKKNEFRAGKSKRRKRENKLIKRHINSLVATYNNIVRFKAINGI